MRSYFIGAMTFCPNYPYQINRMSRYPIVKEQYYKGDWVSSKVDYVLFPSGIVLDDNKRYVWVSMGSQDKNGTIVKFDIEELFQSMKFVNNCS